MRVSDTLTPCAHAQPHTALTSFVSCGVSKISCLRHEEGCWTEYGHGHYPARRLAIVDIAPCHRHETTITPHSQCGVDDAREGRRVGDTQQFTRGYIGVQSNTLVLFSFRIGQLVSSIYYIHSATISIAILQDVSLTISDSILNSFIIRISHCLKKTVKLHSAN